MARSTTSIFIACITSWISINEWFHHLKNTCNSFYHYLTGYSSQYQWLLLPSREFPLVTPLRSITNTSVATWKYDSYHTILTYMKDYPSIICKFSWLSVKIVILDGDIRNEYDMDAFLQQLRIHTIDDVCPQLNDLFIIWCIFIKHWFSPLCTIQYHIIDYMGEERILTLGGLDRMILYENKVYDKIYHKNYLDSKN